MNIHPAPIAAEYVIEYARAHERAAAWIWWAMMCGQAPDMLPYAYRVGNYPVWANDCDLAGHGGPVAADTEPDDFSWLTRENALRQMHRDADRAREEAEFESRRHGGTLHWQEEDT